MELRRLSDFRSKLEQHDVFDYEEEKIRSQGSQHKNPLISSMLFALDLQKVARKRVDAYNAVRAQHEAAEKKLKETINADPQEFSNAIVAIEWKDEPHIKMVHFNLAAITFKKEGLIADALKRKYTPRLSSKGSESYIACLDAIVSDVRKGLPPSAENLATLVKLKDKSFAKQLDDYIKEALAW